MWIFSKSYCFNQFFVGKTTTTTMKRWLCVCERRARSSPFRELHTFAHMDVFIIVISMCICVSLCSFSRVHMLLSSDKYRSVRRWFSFESMPCYIHIRAHTVFLALATSICPIIRVLFNTNFCFFFLFFLFFSIYKRCMISRV